MIRILLDRLQLAWYAVLYGSLVARITATIAALALVAAGGFFLPHLLLDKEKQLAEASTLTVWYASSSTSVDLVEQEIKDLLPGYSIRLVDKQDPFALEEALFAADAGSAPDVVLGGSAMLTRGAENGMFLPLDTELDAEAFPARVLELATIGNRLYGVPYALDTAVFVWNKKLYGTDAPKTFGDLLDWHDEQGRTEPSLCVYDGAWMYQPLLDALGAEPWVSAGNRPTLLENAFGPEFERNFARALDGETPILSTSCTANFGKGEVPFAIVGQWTIGEFTDVEHGTGQVPGVTAKTPGRAWLAGSNAYITKFARERGKLDAATVFTEWVSTLIGQQTLTTDGIAVSARQDSVKADAPAVTKAVNSVLATSQAEPDGVLLLDAGNGSWFTLIETFVDEAIKKPSSLPALRKALVEDIEANLATYKNPVKK